MDLLYLDYNCFQRDFDDSSQTRICMEALACQEIFARAEAGEIQLVWSFMHDDESALCPFPERKYEALRLASLCKIQVGPEEQVRDLAKSFEAQAGLSAKDAIHLACASYCNAAYFLTCDDELIKRAQQLPIGKKVINPVQYIGFQVT